MPEIQPDGSAREIKCFIDYGDGDVRPFVPLLGIDWPGKGDGSSGVREPRTPSPVSPSSLESLSIPDTKT